MQYVEHRVGGGPYIVVVRCSGGHEQRIAVNGCTRGEAEKFAELLDGTSPMYTAEQRKQLSEREDIGRCSSCGDWFLCTIE